MNNRIIIFLIAFFIFLFSFKSAIATLSVLTTQIEGPTPFGTPEYTGIMGDYKVDITNTVETEAYNIVPSTGTFKAMYCQMDVAPTLNGFTFILRTGSPGASIPGPIPALAPTNLACIIDLNSNQECYAVVNVAVTAGDMASIYVENLFDGAGGDSTCSLLFNSDESVSANRSFLTAKINVDDAAGAGRWGPAAGYTESAPTNNDDMATVMPFAGTVRRLCIAHEADPGSGNSRSFSLEVNGTTSALETGISGTQNLNCTTGAITFAAGALLGIKNDPLSSPAVGTWTQGIEVESSTAGLFGFYFVGEDNFNGTSVTYTRLTGVDLASATETLLPNVLANSLEFKDMYCDMQTGVATAGDSYTVLFRYGSEGALGASSIGCAFSNGSGTSASDTGNSLKVNGGNYIDVSMTPAGGPTARNFRWSISAKVLRRFFGN